MWFIGAIAGLMLGAMTGSGAATLLLTVLGGVVLHVVTRGKKPDEAAPDELQELRLKVRALEYRLERVEIKLAEVTASASTPAAEGQESVPAPAEPVIPAAAESAAMPAHREVRTAPPVIVMPPPLPTMPPKPVAATPLPEAFDAAQWMENRPAAEAPPAPPVPPALPQTDTPATPADAAPRSVPLPPRWTEPAAPEEPEVPFRDRLPAPIRNLLYGGNMLVKLGVLILFLGIAFLLRYTAERVTVPVELRYAGVALGGACLLALGWALRGRRRDYGLIMQGMGVGVFYLTTLSAMKFHALVPPGMGFGFMAAVSFLGAALAILQRAPILAIIAALEGFATPVLTATGGNHMAALFTYLAILDAGIVLIAWFNAWRSLNVIGFVGTFTLASGWADAYYTPDQYLPVQAFLVLFFLLFTAVGVFFARRTLLDRRLALAEGDTLAQQAGAALAHVGRVDSALVFGTPLTAFSMQYLLTKPWEFGPAFSALALAAFYLLLARVVFSRERRGLALLAEAYAIVGVIFGTLAIPLGFEGQWTGAAWAVEGAGMFWLGVRQQRTYARAFAYLVLIGACAKLLESLSFNLLPAGPLLIGSTLGPVLLAGSAFAIWIVHRRAELDVEPGWEVWPGRLMLWLGWAALTLLPWQWAEPTTAAAATAILAVAAHALARRFAVEALNAISASLQGLAVLSFIATLHRGGGQGPALAGSGSALFAALIIAACVLSIAGWRLMTVRRQALENGEPPDWPMGNAFAVAVGVALVHLSTLFALSLAQAAIVWPVTACLVLWGALFFSHRVLAGVALGLHVVSVGLFFNEGGFVAPWSREVVPAFAHLAFWTPIVFALTAWFCGDRLRAEAARLERGSADAPDGATGGERWLNPWCALPGPLGLPVLWGLAAWLAAWYGEVWRVLEVRGLGMLLTAAMVATTLLTSLLVSILARWRDWPAMGRASLFTLPALIFSAVPGPLGHAALPSDHWGWAIWPLALAWHGRLLLVQRRWLGLSARGAMHVGAVWFFLLLASRECQLRFAGLSEPYSSWAMMGWIIPSVAWLLWVASERLAARSPWIEFRKSTLEVAALPVALYLFAWCLVSAIVSDGNAAPLPYLPVVNPLELSLWLVVIALLRWWRVLPEGSPVRLNENALRPLVGMTIWLLLTTTVLRSCHHFAGVAWQVHALAGSRLTQAALSIAWAVMGMLAMVAGNRRASRATWFAGAALLGIVVVKLFLVELADRGGLYRIVSFIGVGVLLLVVGYFAPVPVRGRDEGDADAATTRGEA